MGRRRAVAFGAAITGGVTALGSTAFACITIAGMMEVKGFDGNGDPTAGQSVTVGARADLLEFCPGIPIVGGAQAAQGHKITITVQPAACPTGGGVVDKAVNTLGTDLSADIGFHPDVFDISGGSYSYTPDTSRDCVTSDGDSAVITSPTTMAVVDGVGTAEVSVPAGLADSTPSDSAGVCVNASDAIGFPFAPAIAMAPLFVL